MSTPTKILLSPAQVAQRHTVSRRTVMRAVESHELKAIRDNRNHWKIAEDDADTWARAHCAPTAQTQPEIPSSVHIDRAPELAAAKAENDQLRERLKAAESDRDHWRDLAGKLADRPRWTWPWRRK